MLKGIGGEILWVDLTKGKIDKRPLDEEMAKDYLLGAGFLSRIIYDMVPPGTDPLSPEIIPGSLSHPYLSCICLPHLYP